MCVSYLTLALIILALLPLEQPHTYTLPLARAVFLTPLLLLLLSKFRPFAFYVQSVSAAHALFTSDSQTAAAAPAVKSATEAANFLPALNLTRSLMLY